jgi:hypothetical protein
MFVDLVMNVGKSDKENGKRNGGRHFHNTMASCMRSSSESLRISGVWGLEIKDIC